MLEKQTSKGVLKYRMPNILEAYDLLESSGVSVGANALSLKRNIIKSMEPLLDFSQLGFSSYFELLSDIENMLNPLSEIADEIIDKTFDAFKKKS